MKLAIVATGSYGAVLPFFVIAEELVSRGIDTTVIGQNDMRHLLSTDVQFLPVTSQPVHVLGAHTHLFTRERGFEVLFKDRITSRYSINKHIDELQPDAIITMSVELISSGLRVSETVSPIWDGCNSMHKLNARLGVDIPDLCHPKVVIGPESWDKFNADVRTGFLALSYTDHILDNVHPESVVFLYGSCNAAAQRFFAQACQACTNLKIPGIMVTEYRSNLPYHLPSNVQHTAGVNLENLFSRVRAVVHHAGIGTTIMAMKYRLPQLLVPAAFDQFQNANTAKNKGYADVCAIDGIPTALAGIHHLQVAQPPKMTTLKSVCDTLLKLL